jgi:hypothetical protein
MNRVPSGVRIAGTAPKRKDEALNHGTF